jgi:hypothetical protein
LAGKQTVAVKQPIIPKLAEKRSENILDKFMRRSPLFDGISSAFHCKKGNK